MERELLRADYDLAGGLEESDGMVRVGPVHYNTVEEIERLGEALGKIAVRRG